MPEGTVSASYGDYSENVKDIVRALPPWMPRDTASGNFKLLDVIGRAFDRLDEDIRDIDKAATLQTAQSIAEIAVIGEIVGVKPKSNEPLEKYRARVLGEFQTITGEGTIADLITNASILLGVPAENITYELLQPGHATLKVPSTSMNNLSLSESEFAEIMSKQAAAGYKVDITKSGTLGYITPEEYNAGTYDTTAGYDGLDGNGDPKGDGGTYSGIL